MPYQSSRHLGGLAATALLAATLATPPAEAASQFNFTMVRSAGLPATCAPNARATVRVEAGFAEKLTLTVRGFREGTALVLFVIQKPNFPFGLGWYTGDVPVGEGGMVTKVFRSRFNAETFGLALDDVPAPVEHPGDADRNPPFQPVHTFHLGIWFDSPADAARNGCATNTTPFNGDHTAGIQVLSTRNFGDLNGPLKRID